MWGRNSWAWFRDLRRARKRIEDGDELEEESRGKLEVVIDESITKFGTGRILDTSEKRVKLSDDIKKDWRSRSQWCS